MPLARLTFPTESLGRVQTVLNEFKSFCSLPTDPDWVEQDRLLSRLLDTAERLSDSLVGRPYRTSNFQYLHTNQFKSFVLPVGPVTNFEITYSGEELTDGEEFDLIGADGLSPIVWTKANFVRPSLTDAPYQVSMTFSVTGSSDARHLQLIFHLASMMYRNPDSTLPELGPTAQTILDDLKSSFL